MKDTKQMIEDLRQDIERNPSAEGRATTYVERTTRLYREAHTAQDWDRVKAITDELSRNVTEFGQTIASPQPRAGHASGD